MNLMLIVLGGALGAITRFETVNLFKKKNSFPYSTLIINVIGSALLGLFYAQLLQTSTLYTFFAVGFLGAFTTFSTFSVESLKLLQQQQWFTFSIYIFTTITFSILAFSTFFILI